MELIATSDPSDPAHASAVGTQRFRRERPGLAVEALATTTITSSETVFETAIDLVVRVNGAIKAERRWTQSDERRLL